MTRFISFSSLVRFVLAGAVLVAAGSAAGQDGRSGLAKWDQARVTSIAQELTKDIDAFYKEFHNQPPSTIGSGQASAFYRLKQLIRRLRTEGRHLASALDEGKGHDETLPIYQHLMALVRQARDEVQKQFTSDQMLAKAMAAGDAARRLGPYYDAEALSGAQDTGS